MRPRILTFMDYYLPGFRAGGPIPAVRHLVSALDDEFDFRIVTRNHDLADPQPYPDVPADRWTSCHGTPVRYVSPRRLRAPTIRRLVTETAPDVIYLNSFFSPFSRAVLGLRRAGRIPRVPVVLSPRGELAPSTLAHKRFRKRLYLAVAGPAGLCRDVFWQASSPHEAEHIRGVLRQLGEAPLALDVVREIPAVGSQGCRSRRKQAGSLRAVFLGRIVPIKNLDGALRCLRRVAAPVEFHIHGPVEDTAYWTACQTLAASLPGHVTVHYGGALPPAAVPAVLADADLLLCPSHDENFGHVIAEALSQGCPVLISDRTPWHGLHDAGAGWDLPLHDEPGFTAAVEHVAALDEAAHAVMRTAALRFFQHAAHWQDAVTDSRRLFRKAAAAAPAAVRRPPVAEAS
jgi:glycosyltransferase involved in cell wall biosynthesis